MTSAEQRTAVEIGLDPAYDVTRRRGRRIGRASQYLLGAVIPVAVIVAWQVGSDTGALAPLIFSSPERIVAKAIDLSNTGVLWSNLAISLFRVLVGFLGAVVIGTLLGLFSGINRWVERTIDPTMQILRTIPLVAVLPLFLVWFGYSELSKILFILVTLVPTFYVDVHTGVRNVDKKLLEVGKVFKLRWYEVIFGIVIPGASPFIFTSMRRGATVSLILLIFAETLNAKSGLGYLAAQGITYLNVDLTFVIVITYAVLGLLFDTVIRVIQNLATPWRGRKGVR